MEMGILYATCPTEDRAGSPSSSALCPLLCIDMALDREIPNPTVTGIFGE